MLIWNVSPTGKLLPSCDPALILQMHRVRPLQGNPYIRGPQTAGGIDGWHGWSAAMPSQLIALVIA